MTILAKFFLMVEALCLCIPGNSVTWSHEVKYPCRYFGHRMKRILPPGSLDKNRSVIACIHCDAYTPTSESAFRDLVRFGFVVY